MRKIEPQSILPFFALFFVVILGAAIAYHAIDSAIGDHDFGVVRAGIAITLFYGIAVIVYRVFLRFWPLSEGELAPGSRAERIANINILFYLIFFNTFVRTNFLPVPLTRLLYLCLGARIGKNSYSAGAILDPPLTSIGDDCIIGHNAAIFAHAIEKTRLSLSKVTIGNRVTIGASAVVMSGVQIGDDAVVAAGAVVMKGTTIGQGEEWGGVPAKRLRAKPAPATDAAVE